MASIFLSCILFISFYTIVFLSYLQWREHILPFKFSSILIDSNLVFVLIEHIVSNFIII